MIDKLLYILAVSLGLCSVIILMEAYNSNQVLLGVCLLLSAVVTLCVYIIKQMREELNEIYQYLNQKDETPSNK